AGRGERCDDGNLSDADGCDASCGGCVDPATLASTWAAVQANVFDRACTACHGEQMTAGLDLRAPGSYAAIVDVAAATGLYQVKPVACAVDHERREAHRRVLVDRDQARDERRERRELRNERAVHDRPAEQATASGDARPLADRPAAIPAEAVRVPDESPAVAA